MLALADSVASFDGALHLTAAMSLLGIISILAYRLVLHLRKRRRRRRTRVWLHY